MKRVLNILIVTATLLIGSDFKNSSEFNSNKDKIDKILNSYEITYKIVSTHIEYLQIDKTSKDNRYGYSAVGTLSNRNNARDISTLCTYDSKKSSGYQYICSTKSSLGEEYTSWYYFDIDREKLKGKYYVGSSAEAQKARKDNIDFNMRGVKVDNSNLKVTRAF
jgi:hypothetical protein